MKRPSVLLTAILSSGLASCSSPPPVVTAVDTLCASTSRYHSTEDQRKAFAANEDLWRPLYEWLASFNEVRDRRCK